MKPNENQPKMKTTTDIPPGIRTAKASLVHCCAGLDAWVGRGALRSESR